MDLSFVTSLPWPAQVVFFGTLACIYGLVHFGIVTGRKGSSGSQRADGAEIVALTVDSRSIEKLAGEAAGLSVAIEQLVVEAREGRVAMAEQSQQTTGLANEVRELARETSELRHEVSKRKLVG